MNTLEKYFDISWIKKILWIKQNINIVNFIFEEKKHLFIILNLDLRQKNFIYQNKDIFTNKLNNFLHLFNSDNKKYFNIWMNNTEINNILYWNTIILSNIKKIINWYIPINDLWLKYNQNWVLTDFYLLNGRNTPQKNKKQRDAKNTSKYYSIVIELLENKNFSVRKLREHGINTQKSLIINDYIKKLKIFEIDLYDNKKKIYFLDRLNFIEETVINNL